MHNKNIVITGGTDGIGKATACRLAEQGARLFLIGRNYDKGNAAVADIMRNSNSEAVKFIQADLSLVREMRRLTESIRQTIDRIDILVHAAGGTFPQRRTLTEEQLELVFTVQYLARYLLTNELSTLLQAADSPKVLSVAGGGGSKGMDYSNLQSEKSYSALKAIGIAAATNDLLTLEQITRYPNVVFYNYGPGIVRTATIMSNPLMRFIFYTAGRPFSRSADQAANDIIALLTGKYPSGFYKQGLKRNETSVPASEVAKLGDYSKRLIQTLTV